MASATYTPSQIDYARGLRHCLNQLMDDTLNHDLKVVALHLRIAIVELDDVLMEAGLRPSEQPGSRTAA